ncbi:MAG: hypothetical protein ACOXZH_09040 [Bacteroidales bacterium]|jgi:hypothetical protein|nr:hypothetical protein [Bacteroidales bacterium]
MSLYKNKFLIFILVIIFCYTANAQINRTGFKNNYSKTGKSFALIRHGLTGQLAYDAYKTPFLGVGYVSTQYFGIGNRFMQQTVAYQLGLMIDKLGEPHESAFIHNIVGTFHCSYIGTTDLNPFIYGVAIHFATAKDKNVYMDPSDYNTKKGEFMSNIYLRPEIGLSFPVKYADRTEEKVPFTFTITYGYSIKLFMYRNELKEIDKDSEMTLPWTSQHHHMLTMRFNFNFVHYREFQ